MLFHLAYLDHPALPPSASVALGTVDLDEMMAVQYFFFACLVVASMRFSWVLSHMTGALGLAEDATTDEHGPAGVAMLLGPNPFGTIGPIMFNFAFIVTSPPSSAMARREKIAYGALGFSCVVMGTLYAVVGLSGASMSAAVRSGLVPGGDDSNLLSMVLLSGGEDGPAVLDLVIMGLFGLSFMASIPVYCLLAKETLINDAGLAPLPSFLLSNVLPWILVAITYNAAFFEAFVNWSGLLVLGYANFSLPLLLDLKLIQVRAARALEFGRRMMSDFGKKEAPVTKNVFVLVTASITLVIVQSITGSLLFAGAGFLVVAVASFFVA